VIPVPVQVAAVCYRRRRSGIEFLLVRTSSGRWIFPKGRIEESLSNREAAAREAWEEAGALGLIEPRAFHIFRYTRGDPDQDLVFIEAYLLEVLRTGFPEEEHREPTWFNAEEGRRAVSEGRDLQSAGELALVIDVALEALMIGHKRVDATARRRSTPNINAARM